MSIVGVLLFLSFSPLLVGQAGDARSEGNGYNLVRWIVAGGGSVPAENSSGYTVGGTAGQPDVSVRTGEGYNLESTFWGDGPTAWRGIYVPLVQRSLG